MSESTVKTHVAKVYEKLGAHNRASAVMAALRLGLVRSESVGHARRHGTWLHLPVAGGDVRGRRR